MLNIAAKIGVGFTQFIEGRITADRNTLKRVEGYMLSGASDHPTPFKVEEIRVAVSKWAKASGASPQQVRDEFESVKKQYRGFASASF